MHLKTTAFFILVCLHFSEIVHCFQFPCKNGGHCIEEANGYSCNCTSSNGYTGENCESGMSAYSTWISKRADAKYMLLRGHLKIASNIEIYMANIDNNNNIIIDSFEAQF